MALIGNKSILNRVAGKQFGGGVSYMYPEALTPVGAKRNRFYGGFPQYTSTPNAYRPPMALVMAKIDGGMSSNNQVQIVVSKASAVLVDAKFMTVSGSITVTNTNAALGRIFAMTADSTITVAVDSAALSALVSASGSGTITFAKLNAALGGIFPATASGTITITKNTATPTSIIYMTAAAGGATPLSPEGLASAVWDTVIADHLTAGSTGRALSDAGGAGNPWSSPLVGNDTSGTFGERVQKLLTLAKFMGTK